MRAIVAAIGFSLINLAAPMAHAQSTADAAKPAAPKTYALIAAVGEQFTVMFQKESTGSNLPPYVRRSIKVGNNVLNRYVLHSLDKAIAATDPAGKRVFLTLPAEDMDNVSPSEREAVAIGQIVDALQKMPQRQEWDSIIVATPAYKAFALNGVGGRLAGFGVFYKPPLGTDLWWYGGDPYDLGEDAVTPGNKPTRARNYAAPFSFIDIWVLDPKTLAVIDKQQRFDNLKVFDPLSDSIGISQNITPAVLMDKLSSLAERSVVAAVTHSGILMQRGVINVGNIKEVSPGDVKK